MAKTKNNTTKWVIGICIAIALGLGGFWLFKRNNTTDNPEETPVPDDSSPVEPTMTPVPDDSSPVETPSPSSMAENIATGGIPIPVPITPLQQVKATTTTSGGSYNSTPITKTFPITKVNASLFKAEILKVKDYLNRSIVNYNSGHANNKLSTIPLNANWDSQLEIILRRILNKGVGEEHIPKLMYDNIVKQPNILAHIKSEKIQS